LKLAEVDWGVLRGALILLVICVAISAGLMSTSHGFWKKQDRVHKAARSAMLGARTQYQNIDEEEKIIKAYFPLYRALETQGIIGKERRLDWIDNLRRAAQRVELPALSYVIDSQQRFTPDVPLQLGSYQIYSSSMKLDLGLLHEGDLPALLNDLDRNAGGLYTVADCDLRRTQPAFVKKPDAVNLTAACGLHWLTIKQPGAPR
jgi:hypothetical protein